MHGHFLDNYSHLDGPVHRLPAWIKMLAALALILVLVGSGGSWPVLAGAAAVLLMAGAVSRVPAGFLLRRLLLLEPLALGVAVLMLFGPDGLRTFVRALGRATLCIASLILLSNTTPFSDMLAVLRRARVPGLLVTTLALMYRYLHVLSEESRRMRRARTSRSFTRGRTFEWRGLAGVAAHLFVRSTERAERIYAAMCARGWR